MKNILFLFLFILFSCETKSQQNSKANNDLPNYRISHVKNYIKGKDYNQDIAIFINFRIPSNRFRFFIYDLKNNKVLEKAIVSHGSGSVIKGSKELKFSNIENSYQSSLGKYVIMNSYVGTFGKSYRLKGLDKTNSNALKRAIVLHSYHCIPDTETQNPACLSLGCPMLSPQFFKITANYIDRSEKKILLYAFY